MDLIAYSYLSDRNPEGHYIAGIPLRDLTVADLAALTPHQVAGLATCPFYEAAATEQASVVPAGVAGARARLKGTGPSETKAEPAEE